MKLVETFEKIMIFERKIGRLVFLIFVSIVLSRRTFFFLDYPEDYYENFITSNYFMIGYRSVDFYV